MSDESRGDAERLANVAAHFQSAPELPYMVAVGAVSQIYKHIASSAGSVLNDFGLTMPRFEVLALLDQEPGQMSVVELKRATLIHPPTMTYTIDWLEERDLVSREHDKVDRRSIIVHITKKGRKLVADAHAALRDINYGLTWASVDDAEVVADKLVELLRTKQ